MTSEGGNVKNGRTNRKGVSFSIMSQFWTQGKKKQRFKNSLYPLSLSLFANPLKNDKFSHTFFTFGRPHCPIVKKRVIIDICLRKNADGYSLLFK